MALRFGRPRSDVLGIVLLGEEPSRQTAPSLVRINIRIPTAPTSRQELLQRESSGSKAGDRKHLTPLTSTSKSAPFLCGRGPCLQPGSGGTLLSLIQQLIDPVDELFRVSSRSLQSGTLTLEGTDSASCGIYASS